MGDFLTEFDIENESKLCFSFFLLFYFNILLSGGIEPRTNFPTNQRVFFILMEDIPTIFYRSLMVHLQDMVYIHWSPVSKF